MTVKSTIKGKPVPAHFLAVFNKDQQYIGDMLPLDPPALVELQIVGEQMGFQLTLAEPVTLILSSPEIVGVAFLDSRKNFLVGFSIKGDPEKRVENEPYVITSRYIIMAPRKEVPVE